MDSASPNPRGSDSASTSDDSLRLARPPGLGLNLDLGRRSPPRPTPGARTQPRPRKTVSASPDPRARTQPRPRTTVSASPDPRGSDSASTSEDGLRLARPPGLGLNLDLGRRSPPRPTPRARTQPRPRKTVSASPDPRGSDSASTSEDGLRLARPPGPDSASTSEEPPPCPTSSPDRPRHTGGHHYPTPS
jgi:hypothetical protein